MGHGRRLPIDGCLPPSVLLYTTVTLAVRFEGYLHCNPALSCLLPGLAVVSFPHLLPLERFLIILGCQCTGRTGAMLRLNRSE